MRYGINIVAAHPGPLRGGYGYPGAAGLSSSNHSRDKLFETLATTGQLTSCGAAVTKDYVAPFIAPFQPPRLKLREPSMTRAHEARLYKPSYLIHFSLIPSPTTDFFMVDIENKATSGSLVQSANLSREAIIKHMTDRLLRYALRT